MKRLWMWILLIVPLGEVHGLLHSVHIDVYPFLLQPNYGFDAEWLVVDICRMLQFSIISFVAWKLSTYMYGGMRELRLALKAVFYFSLLDIVMYFVCGKMGWYAIVYYAVAILLIRQKFSQGK